MAEKRPILLKAFLATIVLWGGLVLFFVAIGADFDAERRCGWGQIGRCKLTMCGFLRGVVPGPLDTAPCWLLNAMPFMLIPHIFGTRVLADMYQFRDTYAYVVVGMWVQHPRSGFRSSSTRTRRTKGTISLT